MFLHSLHSDHLIGNIILQHKILQFLIEQAERLYFLDVIESASLNVCISWGVWIHSVSEDV